MMSDVEIVNMYLSRDEKALYYTEEVYGDYLLKIAVNILFDIYASQECVNDTYLKTWNSIPPQVPNSLKAFVGKITSNLSIDMLRSNTSKKHNVKLNTSFEELSEFIQGEFMKPENEYEKKELVNAINNFLYSLSSFKRDVFIRRYWYCDSLEEICKRYYISESKAKGILFRTRKKLKSVLEKGGFYNE